MVYRAKYSCTFAIVVLNHGMLVTLLSVYSASETGRW